MKKSCLNQLQKAIYEILAVKYNIYDNVPEKPLYPYVIIGKDTATDRGTKTTYAEDVSVNLVIYSLYTGYKESKDLADEIVNTLSQNPLIMDDFRVVLSRVDYIDSTYNVNPDTTPYRSVVLRYKLIVEQM